MGKRAMLAAMLSLIPSMNALAETRRPHVECALYANNDASKMVLCDIHKPMTILDVRIESDSDSCFVLEFEYTPPNEPSLDVVLGKLYGYGSRFSFLTPISCKITSLLFQTTDGEVQINHQLKVILNTDALSDAIEQQDQP